MAAKRTKSRVGKAAPTKRPGKSPRANGGAVGKNKKSAPSKRSSPKSKATAKRTSPKRAARKQARSTAKVRARTSAGPASTDGKAAPKLAGSVQPRFTEPLRRFSEYETIRSLIEGQAAKYGDRAFMIFEDDGRELSFRALDDRTTRVANLMKELGIVTGSRVALLLDNSPDYACAMLGVIKGGMIAVPLGTDLDDERLRFLLEDSGASCVIADGRYWGRLAPFVDELPGLDAVLLAGSQDTGMKPAANHREDDKDAPTRLIDFDGALEAASAKPLAGPPPRWWDEAQIIYTGQHLGKPRGAILQHRQFITMARWLSVWLNLGEDQRFMSALPMFHTAAQCVALYTPLVTGASVVLSREFNAKRFWKAIERYRVTTLSAVPMLLGTLTAREIENSGGLRAEQPWPASHESPGALNMRADSDAREAGLARAHDISSLERVICGAAPLPTATQKAFEKCFLVPVIEGYCLAETTCFSAVNPANGTRKIGSVGVAVGDKLAVEDSRRPARPLEDWTPRSLQRMSPAVFPTAEPDAAGEICVWGENVMKEYYNRPNLNPSAFAGGWLHTGDIGRLDNDGFLYVHGIRGEEIRVGQERIMPREIDEALYEYERVEGAATVGVEHPRRGVVVTTWVVMRPGTFEGGAEDGRLPADESQRIEASLVIERYLGRRLPKSKQPTRLRFVSRLPRDCAGKTRVFELRSLASRGHDGEEE